MAIHMSELFLKIGIFLILSDLSSASTPDRGHTQQNNPPGGSPHPHPPRGMLTPATNLFANYLPNRIIIPPDYLPSNDKRGYPLEDMDLIWLVCKFNLKRIFLLGRFQFPAITDALLKSPSDKAFPVPINEQIVIYTPDNEVYALLDAGHNFVGLYKNYHSSRSRVRMNMLSKQVSILSRDETKEIPVGMSSRMLSQYQIHRRGPPITDLSVRSRSRSPPLGYALPESSRSRAAHSQNLFANYLPNRIILPPNSLPSNDRHRYQLSQMNLIRIVSRYNLNRIFYFAEYKFPAVTDVILKSPDDRSFPVPFNEQIVIHTADGGVYALLDSDTNFVGLYMSYKGKRPRVKINMNTKQISILGTDETREVPVGSLSTILSKYKIHLKDS